MYFIFTQRRLKLSWIKISFDIVMFLQLLIIQTCAGASLTQCQSKLDCSSDEVCEDRYSHSCQCISGFVRAPSGSCLPERRDEGDSCVTKEQCLHLGLTCYRNRCTCDRGLMHADGSCFEPAETHLPNAPTPPVHLQTIWEPSKQRKEALNTFGGGYVGPIALFVLIFAAFTILIITTSYNFRKRHRRLEEVRSILDTNATTNASAPHVRRASIGSIRDAPPSYNTLSPPSYEQATQDFPVSYSRIPCLLRSTSYNLSMEAAPVSIPDISPTRALASSQTVNESQSLAGPSSFQSDQQVNHDKEDNLCSLTKDRY